MVVLKKKQNVDTVLGYEEIKMLFNAGPFPGGGDCIIAEVDGEVITINSNDLILGLENYELSDVEVST